MTDTGLSKESKTREQYRRLLLVLERQLDVWRGLSAALDVAQESATKYRVALEWCGTASGDGQ